MLRTFEMTLVCMVCGPGLEFIKLEFILRLKIKCNDWLLRKQPIFALYFESETVLKFNNLGAPGLKIRVRIGNLFSLFLIYNICCGLPKHMLKLMDKKIITILR